MGSPLARFVVRVLAWLPAMFAVWMLAAPLLVWPSQLVVSAVSAVGMPDIVRAVEQQGATLTFATSLKPGQASRRRRDRRRRQRAAVRLRHAAVRRAGAGDPRTGLAPPAALGYAAIVPVVAFGVLADFLKNVTITSGALVASQTGFPPGSARRSRSPSSSAR